MSALFWLRYMPSLNAPGPLPGSRNLWVHRGRALPANSSRSSARRQHAILPRSGCTWRGNGLSETRLGSPTWHNVLVMIPKRHSAAHSSGSLDRLRAASGRRSLPSNPSTFAAREPLRARQFDEAFWVCMQGSTSYCQRQTVPWQQHREYSFPTARPEPARGNSGFSRYVRTGESFERFIQHRNWIFRCTGGRTPLFFARSGDESRIWIRNSICFRRHRFVRWKR